MFLVLLVLLGCCPVGRACGAVCKSTPAPSPRTGKNAALVGLLDGCV
ncbi:hypothetical protein AB0L49_47780 [Streptomyces antimycoticus]